MLLKSNILFAEQSRKKWFYLSINAIEGQRYRRYRVIKKLVSSIFLRVRIQRWFIYNTRTCMFDNNAKIITISQHARLSTFAQFNKNEEIYRFRCEYTIGPPDIIVKKLLFWISKLNDFVKIIIMEIHFLLWYENFYFQKSLI